MTGQIVAALASIGLGVVAALYGLVAQVDGGGSDLAPFVSGGGAMAAVGGLVYVARLMASGRLVAIDTRSQNESMKAMAEGYRAELAESRRREDRALQREADYRDALLRARRAPRKAT